MVTPTNLQGRWSTINQIRYHFVPTNPRGQAALAFNNFYARHANRHITSDYIFTDHTKTCLVTDFTSAIHDFLTVKIVEAAKETSNPTRIPSIVRSFGLKYCSNTNWAQFPLKTVDDLANALTEAVTTGTTFLAIYVDIGKVFFDERESPINYRNFDQISLTPFGADKTPPLVMAPEEHSADYLAGYSAGYWVAVEPMRDLVERMDREEPTPPLLPTSTPSST
jgi:hypothetical protein